MAFFSIQSISWAYQAWQISFEHLIEVVRMTKFLLKGRHLFLGESYVSLWKVEGTLSRHRLFSLMEAVLLRRFGVS